MEKFNQLHTIDRIYVEGFNEAIISLDNPQIFIDKVTRDISKDSTIYKIITDVSMNIIEEIQSCLKEKRDKWIDSALTTYENERQEVLNKLP